MTAEVFSEYRARLIAVWVDLESCVQLLKKRIKRRRRWGEVLTGLTLLAGLATGSSTIDVIRPLIPSLGMDEAYLTSLLAFMTAALAAVNQFARLDAKIVSDGEAQNEVLAKQREAVDHLNAFSRKMLAIEDDETISIYESQVDELISKKGFETAKYRDAALQVSAQKPYLKRAWFGPPTPQAEDDQAQGVADLPPLTRG